MRYKCYKCGLQFNKLETAQLHTFITKHNIREVMNEVGKHGKL